MVKIFNPLRGGSPLGAALDSLGKQMFGNNTANALNSEKLYMAQRANAETDNLMRTVSAGGAHNITSDPLAQAMLIGSGYKPDDFGKIALLGGATEFGARDPRTQNLQVGTGQSFDNTAGAFDAKLGETVRNNDMASADRRYGVDIGSSDRRYAVDIGSSDRRYAVDQDIAQKMFEFGNVSANDLVKNTETGRHNLATEGETVRNNDMASADRRYGVDQNIGQQRYEFDSKPVAALGPDGPTFAPQGGVVGSDFAPILSETEQKGTLLGENFGNLPALNPQQQEVLGARVDGSKSSTPRNYIVGDKSYITYDGVTDAQTSAPLPPGGYIGTVEGGAGDVGLTNSTLSGVQQGILANNKFKNLAALTREAATKDPNNFGLPGFIKGVVQDVTLVAENLARGLGYKSAQSFVDDTRQSAMRSGVDPNLITGVFDPDLASLHTTADLMVYSAAEALAGQSGRSVSDKDVLFFKNIVGDPQSWLMSQEKYLAKLTQIERILDINQKTLQDAQTGGAVPQTADPGASSNIDSLVDKYRSR